MGKTGMLVSEFRALGADWVWLAVAVVSSAAGGLLFFVAVFAWLFFRETQFSWSAILGGILILAGVAVVFLGERN
jgi:drug/metabolite transporter (DMT)-like permease